MIKGTVGKGIPSTLNQLSFATFSDFRFKSTTFGGVSKRIGLKSYIHGVGDDATGVRIVNLNPIKPAPTPERSQTMKFMSYPPVLGSKGAQYLLRDTNKPTRFFQFDDMKARPAASMVGSTDPNYLETKTMETYVREHTRGFATQIILEGRGVKASFEPAWPYLNIRMGNGVKVMDVSRLVKRYPGEVKVSISPKGDSMTVHGFNKHGVSHIALMLFKYTRLNRYTVKGGYLYAYPMGKKKSKRN